MYAKVLAYSKETGTAKVFAEDGRTYTTLKLTDGQDVEKNSYVSITPATTLNRKQLQCQVVRAIMPRKIDKGLIRECINRWSQEASRDNGVYVITEEYQQVKTSNKCFIIGRKGTGKTAIAKKIIEEELGAIYSFEKLPLDAIEKYAKGDEKFEITKLSKIWQIIYISLALAKLEENDTTSELVAAAIKKRGIHHSHHPVIKKIKDSLNNPLVGLASEVVCIAPVLGLGFGGINGVSIIKFVLERIFPSVSENAGSSSKVENTDQILKDLMALYRDLSTTPRVVIAFDQLDEEYKNSNIGIYKKLIQSLFSASEELLKENINIKPIVILREDIFETHILSNNTTKLLELVVKLNWTKSSVANVIKERLVQVTGCTDQERTFDELWLDLFEPFFYRDNDDFTTTLSTYEVFIRHTSRTPRDCIKLLTDILNELTSIRRNAINYCDLQTFLSARIEYSKYFRGQIVDALQTEHGKVFAILEHLKSTLKTTNISHQTFLELTKEFLDIDQDLYENDLNAILDAIVHAHDEATKQSLSIGFQNKLKAHDKVLFNSSQKILNALWDSCGIGTLNGQIFTGRYTEDNPSFRLNINTIIAFHPALCVALNLDMDFNTCNWIFDSSTVSKIGSKLPEFFVEQLYADETSRQSIKKALEGRLFNVTYTGSHGPVYHFACGDFNDKLFCESKIINVKPNLGDSFCAVVESYHKAARHCFKIVNLQPPLGVADEIIFTKDLISTDIGREDALILLRGKVWTLNINPNNFHHNYIFLESDIFQHNVFCHISMFESYFIKHVNSLQRFSVLEAEVDIQKDSKGEFGYIVKQIFKLRIAL